MDYAVNIRPVYAHSAKPAMWLTERGSQIKPRTLADTFSEIREEVGLDAALTPHCFRHSFITHMTENGVDPNFLQQISGHRFACTTQIYTHLSGEFMDTMLQGALARISTMGKRQDEPFN